MSGAADGSRWVLLSVALPAALFFVRVRWLTAHTILALFVGWMAFTALWAPNTYDAMDGGWKLALIAMAFLLGAELPSLRPIYLGLGLGLWVSTFVSFLQLAGLHPVLTAGMPHPAGLWVNPNIQAEIASPVVLGLLATGDYWIALGVMPSVLLPMARGALGALGLLASAWSVQRWGWRAALLIVPLVAIACGEIFEKTRHDTGETAQRVAMTLDTVQGLRFWGNGIGSYYALYPRDATHIDTTRLRPNHAHNDTLELAFEGGLPAVVLAAALVFLAFRRGQPPERLVLAALCLEGLVGFPGHMPATAFLFGLVAGHAAGSRDRLRDLGERRRLALFIRALIARYARRLPGSGEGAAVLPPVA
jgi:O-antigen ligase